MGFKSKLKPFSPAALNAWLLFGTVLVVVVSFLLYSLVYVKANKVDQTETRFRVLTQVGKNIVQKEKLFRGIAESIINESGRDKKGRVFLGRLKEKIKRAAPMLKVAQKSWRRGSRYFIFEEINVNVGSGKPTGKYVIYADTLDFLGPLRRHGLLDELILFKEDENGEPKEDLYVLYHTFPGDLHLTIADFMKKSDETEEDKEEGVNKKDDTPKKNEEVKKKKKKEKDYAPLSYWQKNIRLSGKPHKLFAKKLLLDDGGTWYVGGLIEAAKFTMETNRLKTESIVFFVIVCILLILSIPLIKLVLMSSYDQLDISDVVKTSVSVCIGVVAIVLLLLFFYQVFIHDAGDIRKRVERLSESIETKFGEELVNVHEQLNKYNSALGNMEYDLRDGRSFKNVFYPNATPVFAGSTPSRRKDRLETRIEPADYKFFKSVFWMDGDGAQQLQFITRNYDTPPVNLEHRKYFRDAGKWSYPKKGNSYYFMLESIMSVTSGEKLAAISMESTAEWISSPKKSVNLKVVAMTTQLTSLMDSILPVGYGFCIIDEKGDVLFHSNWERNLGENFFNEVGNDKRVLSAVGREHPVHLSLNYKNTEHKCYIKPFAGLPMAIVTFHDTAYANSVRDYTVVDTASFMFVLLLLNGLFLVVAYGIKCHKCKSLRLLKKHTPFEWLWPENKYNEYYQYLMVANLFLAMLLFLFSHLFGRGGTMLLCVLVSFISFLYTYFNIDRAERGGFFFIPDWFKFEEKQENPGNSNETPVRNSDKPESKLKELLGIPVEKSYIFFLLSWLLLVCVVPTIILYLDNYNCERELALKHFQQKLTESIIQRDDRIDTLFKEKIYKTEKRPDNKKLINKLRDDRKKAGIYAKFIGDTDCLGSSSEFDEAHIIDNNIIEKIAYFFRFSLGRIGVEKKDLLLKYGGRSSYLWRKKGNKLHLRCQISGFPGNGNVSENKKFIVSTIKYFNSPVFLYLVLGLILLLLVLPLFYFLVRKLVRKVFSLNLTHLKKKFEFNDAYNEIREQIDAGSDLIIYCQTDIEMQFFSDLFVKKDPDKKGTARTKKVKKSKSDEIPITVDMIVSNSEIESVNAEELGCLDDGNCSRILVKNFRLYEDKVEQKPKTIEDVLNWAKIPCSQVIILTLMHPRRVREYYQEKMVEMAKEEQKLNTRKKISIKHVEDFRLKVDGIKQMIELLEVFETRFVIFCAPLKKVDVDDADTLALAYPEVVKRVDDTIKEFVLDEFGDKDYFKNIEHSVAAHYVNLKTEEENTDDKDKKSLQMIEEDMIMKIQQLAHYYYSKLLDSCTKEEKLVLYDIARDMLVNSGNQPVIKKLLKKNLLVYDGTFRLMNESFRNFILTSIDSRDLKEFVKALHPHSRWKSYKLPLSFIATGFLAFLVFQGNLFSHTNVIYPVIIGALGFLSTVLGKASKTLEGTTITGQDAV